MTNKQININKGKYLWNQALSQLEGAYADSTIRAYQTDIQSFINWCEIIKRKPFPTSPKLLCAFISHEAGRCSVSTIKRRLAAIGKIHRIMKLQNPAIDEEVKLELRRAIRKKHNRPKQALGLTVKLRDQLISACNNSLAGKRDKAIIFVGYDTLTRRSELAAICIEDLTFTEGGAKILIRRSKNDQLGKGRIAYLSSKSTRALHEWISTASITSGAIFRSIKHNRVQESALHPHSINRILKKTAKSAGLRESEIKDLSGHSMRVGAAQDMMMAGLDILPIMAAGGWKSTNVVARYIENANILPLLSRFFIRG